jgi:hypothetical protein
MKKRGCVALKADKGDAIVILREEQYSNNMKDLIEEGPYTVEKRSSLNKMTVQVTKTLRHIKEKYDVNLLH